MDGTMDLEVRRVAHQGMDLKCAIESAMGWLWVDFGFKDAIVIILNIDGESILEID
jgi:hypothetical protein